MGIRLVALQKPLDKLRETIQRLPEDPSVVDVHQLRTQTRRLEAIAAALMLDKERETQQLLKALKPLRKAAGKVRDFDVLIAHAAAFATDSEKDSAARLIEHLGAMRMESAKDMYDVVANHRKDVRRGLKQFSKRIQEEAHDVDFKVRPESTRGWMSKEAVEVSLEISRKLASWPRLSRKTIHGFRIKAKKLRYILQLYDDADPEVLQALGHVKDKIGDWHDWDELAKTAEAVLDADGALLKKIGELGKTKLHAAVEAAQTLRTRHLGGAVQRRTRKQLGRKPPGSVRLDVPAVQELVGASDMRKQLRG